MTDSAERRIAWALPGMCRVLPALAVFLLASPVPARTPRTSPGESRGRIVGGEGWVRPAERRLAGRLKGAAGLWVEFSGDGRRILTAGVREARAWDAMTFKPLGKPMRHGKTVAIRSAGFRADGARAVTGGSDGTARVWDVSTGKQLLKLAHAYEVWSVAFSPDGSKLITADPAERVARVWDEATGRPLLTLRHTHGVWLAAFSRDGGTILTVVRDDVGKLVAHAWDARMGGHRCSAAAGEQRFRRPAALSPDGKRLALARTDGRAVVFDVATGATACVTKPTGELATLRPTTSVSFSADGRKFVTSVPGRQKDPPGADYRPRYIPGYTRVWDSATGKPRSAPLETGDVAEAILSRDGRRVLTAGSYDGTAVWDALSGRVVFVIRGTHSREVPAVAFSPDGARVAAGYAGDGETRIYTVDPKPQRAR